MDDTLVLKEGSMGITPETKLFRASLFWRVNLVCAPVAGTLGFVAMLIWGAVSGNLPHGVLYSFGVITVVALLLYFPGNLSVLWPYAVQIDTSRITLFGPGKTIIISGSEIGEIEESAFWQGSLVHLLKPRAALTQFVIPWYFGSERLALIEAVRHVGQASGAD